MTVDKLMERASRLIECLIRSAYRKVTQLVVESSWDRERSKLGKDA